MIASVLPKVKFTNLFLIALTAFSAALFTASETHGATIEPSIENNGNIGIIKGIVRDENGATIADAYVSIFRVGTSALLKQVRSAADGSFLAKIIPGTYTILAVAEGFNPVTLATVEVNRSSELTYGFKLEKAGGGNTLPEKRAGRFNSKYTIRAAQMNRSIYQHTEGDAPIAETADNSNDDESIAAISGEQASDEAETVRRPTQTVVETYFAGSAEGNFAGVNFATLQPISDRTEIIFVGQSGTSPNAPQRFETRLKFRPNENHQIRVSGSIAQLGKVEINKNNRPLGQFSVQTLDEWKVKNGVILVFGFDYSRFVGAGNDFSIAPRLGFQFDANAKTRVRAAYTTATEDRSWSSVADLEGESVVFREPLTAMQEFVVENRQPRMAKKTRLEFGLERVLDNKSSIETSVFLDTVSNRAVGLAALPFNSLNGAAFNDFIADQQGGAQGARVVYTRRLSGRFSTSAGYAFGSGQKLSPDAISTPSNVFETDFFQTIFGQFDADFKTGTQVKTIFRLSPQATVFAIDPFQGRLAIYDPSLSVSVTQSLPTLGLPIRAQAILAARNLFDYQTGTNNDEGSLRLNAQRRAVRGGILVSF